MQWALPQVDIYVSLLTPFASSLHFIEGSSRSVAPGRRLHRHSKPNGGEAFGVRDSTNDNYDTLGHLHEVQVGIETV